MLAEDIRHLEKQIIVFKNSEPLWVSLDVEKLIIFNLDVLSSVLYRWRSFEATVKIKLKTRSRRLKSKAGEMPTNQTKEEEIGNLPEKEFRILIMKMTQNLEIKMESQINSLETRTEEMQERFNNVPSPAALGEDCFEQ